MPHGRRTVSTYWAGYLGRSCRLEDVPKGIDEVILAFIGPNDKSEAETTFITSAGHTEAEIGKSIQTLLKRGVRVTISLLDTPDKIAGRYKKNIPSQNPIKMHWSDEDFNANTFVDSLFDLAARWGIPHDALFFDLDLETGGSFDGFITLIDAMNTKLQALGVTGPRISAVGYEGDENEERVFKHLQSKDLFTMARTMDYYTDAEGRAALLKTYTAWLGEPAVQCLAKTPWGVDLGTPMSVMKATVEADGEMQGVGIWPLPADTEGSCELYVNDIIALSYQNTLPPRPRTLLLREDPLALDGRPLVRERRVRPLSGGSPSPLGQKPTL